jgi:hypothetical protein
MQERLLPADSNPDILVQLATQAGMGAIKLLAVLIRIEPSRLTILERYRDAGRQAVYRADSRLLCAVCLAVWFDRRD